MDSKHVIHGKKLKRTYGQASSSKSAFSTKRKFQNSFGEQSANIQKLHTTANDGDGKRVNQWQSEHGPVTPAKVSSKFVKHIGQYNNTVIVNGLKKFKKKKKKKSGIKAEQYGNDIDTSFVVPRSPKKHVKDSIFVGNNSPKKSVKGPKNFVKSSPRDESKTFVQNMRQNYLEQSKNDADIIVPKKAKTSIKVSEDFCKSLTDIDRPKSGGAFIVKNKGKKSLKAAKRLQHGAEMFVVSKKIKKSIKDADDSFMVPKKFKKSTNDVDDGDIFVVPKKVKKLVKHADDSGSFIVPKIPKKYVKVGNDDNTFKVKKKCKKSLKEADDGGIFVVPKKFKKSTKKVDDGGAFMLPIDSKKSINDADDSGSSKLSKKLKKFKKDANLFAVPKKVKKSLKDTDDDGSFRVPKIFKKSTKKVDVDDVFETPTKIMKFIKNPDVDEINVKPKKLKKSIKDADGIFRLTTDYKKSMKEADDGDTFTVAKKRKKSMKEAKDDMFAEPKKTKKFKKQVVDSGTVIIPKVIKNSIKDADDAGSFRLVKKPKKSIKDADLGEAFVEPIKPKKPKTGADVSDNLILPKKVKEPIKDADDVSTFIAPKNPIKSVKDDNDCGLFAVPEIPKKLSKTSKNTSKTVNDSTQCAAGAPNNLNKTVEPVTSGGSAHIPKKFNNQQEQLAQQRQLLPVYQCRKHLMEEVQKSDTLVIMGETGSGKTTQIPQLLYEHGYARNGVIGITQPRRVAAITIAKRVAQERQWQLGDLVGYTVRFEDCTTPKTRIRFLTDGSLLREALADSLLCNYSVLMLDEAHERTVNTDVLFGLVKKAQNLRSLKKLAPLKVIVTSATMDIDNFSAYFGVRGMYLKGRMHPVNVMHVKVQQPDYLNSVLVTLFDIHRNKPLDNDVLIFLTGQEEIESMAHQIRQIAKTGGEGMAAVRVFPLYAQMPQNKQLECFLPSTKFARKIVLATNIAETSITIPGIRCVIDCGFIKRRTFTPSSGLEVLRAVRISQAQAWQRCGRAGRDTPGICYRTYTQDEMASFEKMPKPEILRSNICATALQLLALGIECNSFDFIDKPSPEAVDSAYQKLEALGAIKSAKTPELTQLGHQMNRFPLDPQYSKLLLCAPAFGCMAEMLSLVAMLSSENVFISTADKREYAALAHAKFQSKHGDHLTLLNVFMAFQKTQKVKQWCHDNFLNARNLQYAADVRKQLLEVAERLELKISSCGTNYDQVRKCLLAGLFQNIAELQRDNFYLTIPSRQRAKIHPSSVFHGKYRPQYIIYTEMVLTERNFLRQVTEISSEWIAEVVPKYAHLNRIKNPLQ